MRILRNRSAALPLLAGLVLSVSVSVSVSGAVTAEEISKSAPAAKALTDVLDKVKPASADDPTKYIATRDPEDPTRFVGAMYLPGLQLITVSGKYSQPVLLNEKLLKKDYREIYLDLSSASDRNTRVVIEDLRADGLPSTKQKDGPPDAYETGTASGTMERVVFDWDWKKQKLSEKDYLDKLATADTTYTRLLGVLLEEAKKGS